MIGILREYQGALGSGWGVIGTVEGAVVEGKRSGLDPEGATERLAGVMVEETQKTDGEPEKLLRSFGVEETLESGGKLWKVVNLQEGRKGYRHPRRVKRRMEGYSGAWKDSPEPGRIVKSLEGYSGDWKDTQETGRILRRLK